MSASRFGLRLTIYALLILTFFLGLPQMHYAAALFIAVLIRHKNEPKGILGPVNSTELDFSFFKQGPKILSKQSLPKSPNSKPKPVYEEDDSKFI